MKSSPFIYALGPAIFTGVAGAGWEFVQNGTSGVLALETIIVSPTLAVFFDFATTGVYPPGPAYIFLTVGDKTSAGIHVMVGSGASPPVPDQGRRI
ncbi:hypothetical protein C8R44DRAFT_883547 [Mycena epipterygia]|nr:hypothetical protein C8R44DRAFT_883547 [Mycena epipterygia]